MKNKCLIVDDNPLVLNSAASMVRHIAACPVECRESGAGALAVFKDDPEAFACVITDFDMPGTDGIQLADLLRATAPEVKLLLMTGNPAAVQGMDLLAHGFDGVLEKPFDLATLRRALYSVLPPLNNSTPPRSQNLNQRSISFFERTHGFRRRSLEKKQQTQKTP